ncbi:MAG: hypothetical protein V3R73_02670, partial [Sphingomonadales bacterium]
MASENKKSLKEIADILHARRRAYDAPPDIRMDEAGRFLRKVLGLVLPQFSEKGELDAAAIEAELAKTREELVDLFGRASDEAAGELAKLADQFIAELPEIAEEIRLDATAAMEGDPAANSLSEVIITYPGTFAVAAYRIAHRFY